MNRPLRIWDGYNASGVLIAFGGGNRGHLKLIVDRFLELWTVGRHVVSVIVPVLEAARLPIALGAFLFCAAVLFVLARALRVVPQPAPASS